MAVFRIRRTATMRICLVAVRPKKSIGIAFMWNPESTAIANLCMKRASPNQAVAPVVGLVG